MKFFRLIILLTLANYTHGQVIYMRNDTMNVVDDSIVFKSGQSSGEIQWQRSFDGKTWNNIAGKTDKTLKVEKNSDGYYRSIIYNGSCISGYSDTAVLFTKKQNNSTFDPDEIEGITIIEKNFENNKFVFLKSGLYQPVSLGSVFVDKDKPSQISVVNSIRYKGDSVFVDTEKGTFEDIFVNQEFKLTTETEPVTELKKGGNINNNYFIHPIKVIDHYSSFKTKSFIEGIPSININKDLSGYSLYDKNGLKLYISNGYFRLNGELVSEFQFENNTEFKWFQVPKGKLKKFAIYTTPSTLAESQIFLTAEAKGELIIGDTITLMEEIFDKSFSYMIGSAWVWMNVKIDLMAVITDTISSDLSISAGYSSSHNIKLGAIYEGSKWDTIYNVTNEFTGYPPELDGFSSYNSTLEIYPHIEVIFYKMAGPYLDIAPYLSERMDYSIEGNYNSGLYTGVNARLGIKANILGENIFDFNKEFKIIEDTLYEKPYDLIIVSGDDQRGQPGCALSNKIILKVIDSEGEPVSGCPVYFNFPSGIIDSGDRLVSDENGEVPVIWILGNFEGLQHLEGFLKNGKDLKMDSISVKATASNLGIFMSIGDISPTGMDNETFDVQILYCVGGLNDFGAVECGYPQYNPNILSHGVSFADQHVIGGKLCTGSFVVTLTGLKYDESNIISLHVNTIYGNGYFKEVIKLSNPNITEPGR